MKICGIDYTIKYYNPGELVDEENELFGQFDMGKAEIRIGRYGKQRELETLRHEIAHVYIAENLLCMDEFSGEDVCMLIGKYGQEICDLANKILKVK